MFGQNIISKWPSAHHATILGICERLYWRLFGQLTYAREVWSGICERWLPAAVCLRDGDLLDELERLEDVGNVVEAPNARLHDRLGQPDPVDHSRGKVQVDLSIGLKKL